MVKQRAVTDQDRKSVQMNITVSPILKRELEELVERGYFSNVSDAVRYAIHEMLARFRAEGRLPPDSAEERIRHARLIEEREGELE